MWSASLNSWESAGTLNAALEDELEIEWIYEDGKAFVYLLQVCFLSYASDNNT